MGRIKHINKYWHSLQSDLALRDITTEPPRFIFKRARNIQDRLVHSDVTILPPTTCLPNPQVGFYKSGTCVQCSNSTNSKVFLHPRMQWCGQLYVRQTERQLKISEHKTAIRTNNTPYAMARHYMEANHGSAATLQFWGDRRNNHTL